MELYLAAATIVLGVIAGFLVVHNLKLKHGTQKLEGRFARVLDVDKEVEEVTRRKSELELLVSELRGSYKEKKALFDKLINEVAIYDEEIQLAELGFYKPHFAFDDSQTHKDQIAQVRQSQKKMVSENAAIFCHKEWAVEGSRAKGRTMTNRGIRLTARAFNNECDAAVSNVSWNNAQRMEQRIAKAFDAINKLNESNAIEIAPVYRDLKLKELQLTYEYRVKLGLIRSRGRFSYAI